jgi:hypothetical protein
MATNRCGLSVRYPPSGAYKRGTDTSSHRNITTTLSRNFDEAGDWGILSATTIRESSAYPMATSMSWKFQGGVLLTAKDL